MFDVRYATLELEKERLEHDIKAFHYTKDSLNTVNERFLRTNDSLAAVSASMNHQVELLRQSILDRQIEVARAEASLKPMAERAAYFEQEVQRAKAQFAQSRTGYVDELSRQHSNEFELSKHVKEQRQVIEQLRDDTAYLRLQIGWLMNSPMIPRNKRSDFEQEFFRQRRAYHAARSNAIREELEKIQRHSDSLDRSYDSVDHRWRMERITKPIP